MCQKVFERWLAVDKVIARVPFYGSLCIYNSVSTKYSYKKSQDVFVIRPQMSYTV